MGKKRKKGDGMTPDQHDLRLIRGGKPPAWLGLPCDSCDWRHEAPGACGECAFLAARQRVIADRRKVKDRQRRKTRQEVAH